MCRQSLELHMTQPALVEHGLPEQIGEQWVEYLGESALGSIELPASSPVDADERTSPGGGREGTGAHVFPEPLERPGGNVTRDDPGIRVDAFDRKPAPSPAGAERVERSRGVGRSTHVATATELRSSTSVPSVSRSSGRTPSVVATSTGTPAIQASTTSWSPPSPTSP